MKTRIPKDYLPILVFILIWIPSFFLAKYAISGTYEVNMLNFFYVLLFILATVFSFYLFKDKRIVVKKKRRKRLNKEIVFKIIKWTALIALIGIISLIIDRIFIKKINYSAGLRNARYQWLYSEVSSSILGKAGNLFIPFSYVSLYFSYINWESIRYKIKYLGIIAGLIVPLGHAILNGGRSNLLILLIFLLTISFIRFFANKSFFPKVKNKKMIIVTVSLIIILYVLSIFNSSADLGGVSQKVYLYSLFATLGGRIDLTYINKIGLSLLSLIVYIYHGTWITGSYLTEYINMRNGYYTSSVISDILNFFGIQKYQYNSVAWEGAFLNVPGAFFHDFGYIGVGIMAFFSGLLFGYCISILKRKKGLSIIELILIIFIFTFNFLSPMVYVFGLAYFKFLIYAFVVTGIILKLKFGSLDFGVMNYE